MNDKLGSEFWSFFWTQFLGALNDNLFKNALVIAVTYRSMTVAGLAPGQIVALCGALFILPFVLFSTLAGQLADRCRKDTLVRVVKAAELPIMGLAAWGFARASLPLLLAALFLMGAQSSFFGPVKYSILPQLLPAARLTAGNALVETGTFLAVLAGTIAGGVAIGHGTTLVSLAVLTVALAGWLASWRLPRLAAASPQLRISLDPVRPLLATLRAARQSRPLWLAMRGISWFWCVGAVLLSLLPDYGKTVLRVDEQVVTLLLALVCIGIAAGSWLCARLSRGRLELGVIPLGALGMALAAFDLCRCRIPELAADVAGIAGFLAAPGCLRIAVDHFLLAASGGLFVVPLYTLLQEHSQPTHRSRVIAASNILGALFMVASALLLAALLGAGMSIPDIFALLAVLNAAVALYAYRVAPEFVYRFAAAALMRLLYRLRIEGAENIPARGAAIVVANHVSFIDWLLIAGASPRPPRFVMYHGFQRLPLLGWFFRDAKVIPIAPQHESAATLESAFDRIAAALEAGELVCLFPEGKLSRDGCMNEFRSGVERVVRRTPVPVVPIAIRGMWGSFFSHKDGRALRRPFRRVWSRVSLVISPQVEAAEVSAAVLAARVAELGGFTIRAAADC